jgi:signal transduction histidine kinase
MMPKNPFSLYKNIIAKEQEILNKARIAILVTGLFTFFLMGVVLLTLCIIRQHVFSVRICVLMTLFAGGIMLLLAGVSWRIITHFFILCVSYLIWSNLIFYNLYFLVAIQYILIIVTCSYYILGVRWGLFYSVCNISPFAFLILHYVLKGPAFLEQVSNYQAFSIIFVFNFTLLIFIHYYFFKAFRESNDKEKAMFVNLEQSLAALRLLMEKKDEFLGLATHELKTPITSIKASLQSLQRMVSRNELMKESIPLVTIATRQADKLAVIANDLVDTTKINSGKLQLNKTVFPLSITVADCIREIQHQAKDYEFIFEPDDQYIVLADKIRIEQVLCNLLTNAVKYSPKSRIIKLNIEVLDRDIKVSIKDQGIGIPPDKLPYIFDRFFRVHESSQLFPGLGLGLFISAEIISQHEGKIGVQSEEDEGSVFWFSLPLHKID